MRAMLATAFAATFLVFAAPPANSAPECISVPEYNHLDRYTTKGEIDKDLGPHQRGHKVPIGRIINIMTGHHYSKRHYVRYNYPACKGAEMFVIYEKPNSYHPRTLWWVHMDYVEVGDEPIAQGRSQKSQ